MPQPGTAMLQDLLSWLVSVVLVAGASTLLVVVLVRRSAVHLVVAEAQASTAARTDPLTGLPNRAAFNDVLGGRMITMAHGLGLRVVCEGVETAEELHLLRGVGCDLARGFQLDRRLPIQLLAERWLEADGALVAVA